MIRMSRRSNRNVHNYVEQRMEFNREIFSAMSSDEDNDDGDKHSTKQKKSENVSENGSRKVKEGKLSIDLKGKSKETEIKPQNKKKSSSGLRRSTRLQNETSFFESAKEREKQNKRFETQSLSNEDLESESDFSSESGSSLYSDEGAKKSKNRSLPQKSKSCAAKPSAGNRVHKTRHLSSSSSEEKESGSESEGESDWTSSGEEKKSKTTSARDRQKRSSRRQTTQMKISYKEESDNGTDSEDLIEISELEDMEMESSESIEKVLRVRKGRNGATGSKTTFYNVEMNGDPNSGLDLEKEQNETEVQYLIKWKNMSHIHNTWESEATLCAMNANGMRKLDIFKKREEEMNNWQKTATPEDIEYYDCQRELTEELYVQYCDAERVVAQYPPKSGADDIDYLVKWQGLPYSECTRETCKLIKTWFPAVVDQFEKRQKSIFAPNRHSKALKVRPKFHRLRIQPDYIGGNAKLQLRDYQLEGLNWLLHSWCKENGAILADEMGLGKTIQTISFLSVLMNAHQVYGPFLLIVPLSTVVTWQREFQAWAPQINVTVYIGDITTRSLIREYEWYHEGSNKLKCNVIITTYEIVLKDKSHLSEISWAVLGIDEAHRLKNDDSMLYKSLIDFDTNHRLFITGTPLQNSLRELWSLLHFIMPNKFDNWEKFEQKHSLADKTGFRHLHQELEPYLLRRVKKDVEKSLPAKVEQILRVEMSRSQKQFYRWILTRNYKALAKGVKGNISGFVNLMMELKKCCNHVTLVQPMEDENSVDNILEMLVKGSGKLLLLDKLLPRLKASGHRVLIFSQMVRMLDIIASYLRMKGYYFQRLDGTINSERRKQAMDHFNADGSQDFCFLLSTRAGGLGVNLVTADTVIIFDSDWNPQNDLQAMARAHRIGQKNQVSVYRLVTKNSIEEEIIERAKKKMVLDHLVIQRMDTSGRTVLDRSGFGGQSSRNPFSKEELNSILKFGAEELFKESDEEDGDTQVDIDDILRLAETRNTEEVRNNATDELLSNFKIVSFENLEEDPVTEESAKHEAKDWNEIIPEKERQKIEEEERKLQLAEINLPPRSRRNINEVGPSDSDVEDRHRRRRRLREDEEDEDSESSEEESEDGDRQTRKRGGRAKEAVKGFTDAELRRFIKSMKKFARPRERLEDVAEDAQLQEKSESDLQHLADLILTNCEQAIKDFNEKQKDKVTASSEEKKMTSRPTFRLGSVTINARSVLSALQELEPLAAVITSDVKVRLQLEKQVKRARFDCYWTLEDDMNLLKGVYNYGMGNWEAIKMDSDLKLLDKILPDLVLKPQGKQLQTRTDYLLRILREQMPSEHNEDKASSNKSKRNKKRKRKDTGGDDASDVDSHEKDSQQKRRNKDRNVEKMGRKEDSKGKTRAPVHITTKQTVAADDGKTSLSDEVFAECKEKMKSVRKSLKLLGSPSLSRQEKDQMKLMKENLLKIGNRISEILTEYNDPDKIKECRNNLWQFVSVFTEFDANRLHKIYKIAARKQQEEKEREMLEEQARQSETTLHYGNHPLNANRIDHEHWRESSSKRLKGEAGDGRTDGYNGNHLLAPPHLSNYQTSVYHSPLDASNYPTTRYGNNSWNNCNRSANQYGYGHDKMPNNFNRYGNDFQKKGYGHHNDSKGYGHHNDSKSYGHHNDSKGGEHQNDPSHSGYRRPVGNSWTSHGQRPYDRPFDHQQHDRFGWRDSSGFKHPEYKNDRYSDRKRFPQDPVQDQYDPRSKESKEPILEDQPAEAVPGLSNIPVSSHFAYIPHASISDTKSTAVMATTAPNTSYTTSDVSLYHPDMSR